MSVDQSLLWCEEYPVLSSCGILWLMKPPAFSHTPFWVDHGWGELWTTAVDQWVRPKPWIYSVLSTVLIHPSISAPLLEPSSHSTPDDILFYQPVLCNQCLCLSLCSTSPICLLGVYSSCALPPWCITLISCLHMLNSLVMQYWMCPSKSLNVCSVHTATSHEPWSNLIFSVMLQCPKYRLEWLYLPWISHFIFWSIKIMICISSAPRSRCIFSAHFKVLSVALTCRALPLLLMWPPSSASLHASLEELSFPLLRLPWSTAAIPPSDFATPSATQYHLSQLINWWEAFSWIFVPLNYPTDACTMYALWFLTGPSGSWMSQNPPESSIIL